MGLSRWGNRVESKLSGNPDKLDMGELVTQRAQMIYQQQTVEALVKYIKMRLVGRSSRSDMKVTVHWNPSVLAYEVNLTLKVKAWVFTAIQIITDKELDFAATDTRSYSLMMDKKIDLLKQDIRTRATGAGLQIGATLREVDAAGFTMTSDVRTMAEKASDFRTAAEAVARGVQGMSAMPGVTGEFARFGERLNNGNIRTGLDALEEKEARDSIERELKKKGS